MIYLPRRQWQVLQWFETQAPVGTWIYVNNPSIKNALNISKSHMAKLARELEEVGVVESRRINNRGSREVRVLIPLADPRIEPVHSHMRSAENLQKLRRDKPKKLIRYAGWEPQAGWNW